MLCLGRTSEESALEFVKKHVGAELGSLAGDGSRRVVTEAIGDDLERQKTEFELIAIGPPAPAQPAAVVLPDPVPCIHRRSARNVCCGSPRLWICGKLKQDCVATGEDKTRLASMVATKEAAVITACDSCTAREESSVTRIVEIDRQTVAVVIPCHNYGRYLAECLQSVLSQTVAPAQIIVVDDSSDDDTHEVCSRFPSVRYLRCELQDVHKARQFGLREVQTVLVSFLDADDKLPPNYIENALEVFRTGANVAIAFPPLEYFGDAQGPAHGTQHSPHELRGDDIEQRNWIPAGSVIRTELLHQSLAFDRNPDPKLNWSQDWHVVKAVLRSGNWIARKMLVPLLYRKHGTNMSSRDNSSYWNDADLQHETVTIVIAFSGRWDAWKQLLPWLLSQSWPIKQTRLLILNATHQTLSPQDLGLNQWQGSLQIERLDAGYPRLADIDRRNAPLVSKKVEAAVASLYNRATSILGTEYVVFVEDDVIPHDHDLIERMFRNMGPWVSGVSGVYRQRYQIDKCCSFDLPFKSVENFKPLHGTGVEQVGGSGFGCLMTRRSLLRRFPLAGDTEDGFFDIAFASACSRADNGWWKWLLDRNIQANHLIAGDLDDRFTSENASDQSIAQPFNS